MEPWYRDYWSGRRGHEHQFITLEGELDKTGEMRGLWDAQGGIGSPEAVEDFVGGIERETTVCQVADVRGHVGLNAKERADLGRARNSGKAVLSGKLGKAGRLANISFCGTLSSGDGS